MSFNCKYKYMKAQNKKQNDCCDKYKGSKEFIYCPECQSLLQPDEAGKKGNGGNLKGELDKAQEELAKTQKRVKELETDKNNAEAQKAIDEACKKVQQDANKTILELQNKLKALNDGKIAEENEKKEKTIHRLKSENTALNDEVKRLEGDIKTREAKIDKLTKTIETSGKDITELNEKIKIREAKIAENIGVISRLTVDAEIRNDEIKRLKEQISGNNVSIGGKVKKIDELNTTLVEKEAKYKVYRKIMLIATSVVAILALIFLMIAKSSEDANKSGGLMTVSFSNVIGNLEGSYTLSQTSNGQKIGRGISAVITEIATGEYKVETHDQENSPIPYYFSIGQHTLLNSPDMGVGDIKYTKNGKYNKISLEFRKGNTVWNYTKR